MFRSDPLREVGLAPTPALLAATTEEITAATAADRVSRAVSWITGARMDIASLLLAYAFRSRFYPICFLPGTLAPVSKPGRLRTTSGHLESENPVDWYSRSCSGWGSGEFEKGMFCLSRHADPGCFDEKTALELACLAGIGIQHRGFLSYFLVFARFPAKCSLGELLIVRKREPRAQASIKSQPAVRSLPSVCRDCRKRRGKKRNFLSEFALALPFASG